MRKILLSVLLMIGFASCSDNSAENTYLKKDDNKTIPIEERITSFTSTFGEITKVGLDQDGLTFKWNSDDKILMCEISEDGTSFTGKNVEFIFDKNIDSDKANFICSGDDFMVKDKNYIAMHKASGIVAGPVAGATTINYAMPEITQTASGNDYLSNMLFTSAPVNAKGSSVQIALTHTMSVMKFILKNGNHANKILKHITMIATTKGSFAQKLAINTDGTINTESSLWGDNVAVSINDDGAILNKEIIVYALVSAKQATGVSIKTLMIDNNDQKIYENIVSKPEKAIKIGSLNNTSIDCSVIEVKSYVAGEIYPYPRSGKDSEGVVILGGTTGRMIHKESAYKNRNDSRSWATGRGSNWILASAEDYRNVRANLTAVNNGLAAISGSAIVLDTYWANDKGGPFDWTGTWFNMSDGTTSSSAGGSIIPSYNARAAKSF